MDITTNSKIEHNIYGFLKIFFRPCSEIIALNENESECNKKYE